MRNYLNRDQLWIILSGRLHIAMGFLVGRVMRTFWNVVFWNQFSFWKNSYLYLSIDWDNFIFCCHRFTVLIVCLFLADSTLKCLYGLKMQYASKIAILSFITTSKQFVNHSSYKIWWQTSKLKWFLPLFKISNKIQVFNLCRPFIPTK